MRAEIFDPVVKKGSGVVITEAALYHRVIFCLIKKLDFNFEIFRNNLDL